MTDRKTVFGFGRLSRDWGGNVDDDRAKVAELHWSDGRVVQISSHPNDDGVLIRVWPRNGTHEYGGSNVTAASISLKWAEDGGVDVEHFEVRAPWERTVAMPERLPRTTLSVRPSRTPAGGAS